MVLFQKMLFYYNCSSLKKVAIPDNVEIIGIRAFLGCTALTEVRIPTGVWIIGYKAFENCSSLQSVTLPKSLRYLRTDAFAQCTNLEHISIPEGFQDIGKAMFSGTKWMEKKKKENPVIIVNKVLIDGGNPKGRFVIPKGVERIGEYAFGGCQNLTEAAIPNYVKSIGGGAFEGCKKLKNVRLPDGLRMIDAWTFSGCESLESIELPPKVTTLWHSAFSNCKNLKKVMVLGKASLGYSVFSNCSNLRDVIFVKGMGDFSKTEYAFDNCSKDLVVWGKNGFEGEINTGEQKVLFRNLPQKIKVTFVKNGGGKPDRKSIKAPFYEKYGKLATVSRKGYLFDGWYTEKEGGSKVTAAARIENPRAHKLYAHWTKISLDRASITKLKKSGSGKLRVKWKKVPGAEGYQLLWADNKKFRSAEKKLTNRTVLLIKKAKTGGKCYVKVRAYKTDSAGKKVYGTYSKVQKPHSVYR